MSSIPLPGFGGEGKMDRDSSDDEHKSIRDLLEGSEPLTQAENAYLRLPLELKSAITEPPIYQPATPRYQPVPLYEAAPPRFDPVPRARGVYQNQAHTLLNSGMAAIHTGREDKDLACHPKCSSSILKPEVVPVQANDFRNDYTAPSAPVSTPSRPEGTSRYATVAMINTARGVTQWNPTEGFQDVLHFNGVHQSQGMSSPVPVAAVAAAAAAAFYTEETATTNNATVDESTHQNSHRPASVSHAPAVPSLQVLPELPPIVSGRPQSRSRADFRDIFKGIQDNIENVTRHFVGIKLSGRYHDPLIADFMHKAVQHVNNRHATMWMLEQPQMQYALVNGMIWAMASHLIFDQSVLDLELTPWRNHISQLWSEESYLASNFNTNHDLVRLDRLAAIRVDYARRHVVASRNFWRHSQSVFAKRTADEIVNALGSTFIDGSFVAVKRGLEGAVARMVKAAIRMRQEKKWYSFSFPVYGTQFDTRTMVCEDLTIATMVAGLVVQCCKAPCIAERELSAGGVQERIIYKAEVLLRAPVEAYVPNTN